MRAHDIRQHYIEFFKERGHLQLPSASLVPVDALGNADTSTLFTGSGMQQFKPFFTGAATPPSTRVTTVQKCVRVKDIDEVGDFSHCTFFEMLGNFSFGDYFKSDVIPWTWEFLTRVVGLDAQRLCVTVFVDDDEAYNVWHDMVGLPADRIHRLGEDKNYWPANAISEGPNGPCGPCSEIFYRVAPLEEMTSDPALTPTQRYLIDDSAGRWTEIWNNVFTQFNRSEDENGKAVLNPLPKKNNDTGAGLDRIAYCALNKTSVFETDLFGPILDEIGRLSGKTYTSSMSPTDFAFRVVAEHTRSMVFCIADGILPGNEGRDYVLRYIMRRAIRYGKTALGFEEPFLHEVAPGIIAQMGDFYPELIERRELILSTIKGEEERFRRTLDNGIRILTVMLESGTVQETKVLPGKDAFKLYDTYGFPLSLTMDIARENGVTVDEEGYKRAVIDAKPSETTPGDVFEAAARRSAVSEGLPLTRFQGYTQMETESTIVAIFKGEQKIESAAEGDEVTVVLDQTPFYAESGGQVGDRGFFHNRPQELHSPESTKSLSPSDAGAARRGVGVRYLLDAEVLNTRKASGVFLHTVKVVRGELKTGQAVTARVDAGRRRDIMRNHTATHLLQAALRQVLGGHVHQKGSLVAPDRLRFDFTHGQQVTLEELHRIEQIVNMQALADNEVMIDVDVPIDEARARGAMALFGEKYGDYVRVVTIPGFSLELCGGTHLTHTSQVGLFKILSETGVSSGVRRIEAVTGQVALDYVNRQEAKIAAVATLLKSNPNDVVTAAERLLQQRQELEKQNRQLKVSGQSQSEELAPTNVHGIPVVVYRQDGADGETIANLVDRAAQKLGSAVIVIGSLTEGKAAFTAKVTKDLVGQGLHAGNLVRDIAKIAGGGGGGRPDFAQAGGRDPSKLQEALDAVPRLLKSQLATVSK